MDAKNNRPKLQRNLRIHRSEIPEAERELNHDIKSALKAVGNERITPLEAAELWARIQNSNSEKGSVAGWKWYLRVAASIMVVLAVGIWYFHRNTSSDRLLEFAAQNINKKSIPDYSTASPSGEHLASGAEENIITTNEFNTLVVGDGKRTAIVLPDETRVWLNSGSKLIYPITFSTSSRDVYLEGEGYFDVAHNKQSPFIVHGKNMDIKVLGTEFYVSSGLSSNTDYAVLVKGSIAFSAGDWLNKSEETLEPGERIVYSPQDKDYSVSRVPTEEFEAWKNGYLQLESEPLDSIVRSIARYYNIEISTEGLSLINEKFTGRLDFQNSADDVLAILCAGTSYVYNNKERRLELRKH